MKIFNFAEQNSVLNQYMAELRDKDYQKNRLLFRNNINRIGELMAYEVSKTLNYKPHTVTTPLGTAEIPQIADDIVLATVLRAGVPMHEGFLRVFENAENAFISAYREYTDEAHTQVRINCKYMASPSIEGKVLMAIDPMLATGGSQYAALTSLLRNGTPSAIHVCCVVGTPEGVEAVKKTVAAFRNKNGEPIPLTIWAASIDPGMNEQKYIVPGFGDCGDLCYGEKL